MASSKPDNTCTICLSTIDRHNQIINPCCKNSFCTTCIYTNISLGNTTCPLCRHEHIQYRSLDTTMDTLFQDGEDMEEEVVDDININEYVIGLENRVYELLCDKNDLKRSIEDIIKIYQTLSTQHTFYKCLLLCHELISSNYKDSLLIDIDMDWFTTTRPDIDIEDYFDPESID